ncbi:MAG: hypothetical protein ACFB10_25495 [Salibacteraceae bacterium]
MHILCVAGFGAFSLCILINLYLLVVKLLGNDIGDRPLLILGLMLVLGGIQLITIGIIMEILMRTYFESQSKHPYQIRNTFVGK